MSDTQISEVHQSEGGEAGRTRPSAQGGQPRSRVFGSSLSRGNACRCPLWLWRDYGARGCWGGGFEVLDHGGFQMMASAQSRQQHRGSGRARDAG